MPVRSNQHITVRPLTRADTDSLFATVRQSIESLCYWMPWCTPHYSHEDAATWTALCETGWRDKTEFPLGIFDAMTGQVMGATGINNINHAYHSGNLGYWLGTPYRTRGFASVAALMAADIAFTELGLTRLEIVVLLNNEASHRVARAVGATRECNARNRLYFQGQPAEATVYSLVPSDFPMDRLAASLPLPATRHGS